MAPPSSDDQTLVTPTVDSDQTLTPNFDNDDLDHDDDFYEDESDSDSSERRRRIRNKHVVRIVSLLSSVLIALCAGSIQIYSLFAPSLQSRLHYTQFQINGVAIGGSLALYLPVSVMGFICDRAGVAPLSLLAAFLLGPGYGLAAVIYRKVDLEYNSLGKGPDEVNKWSYPLMIFAFVLIGVGTCAMYISCLSACAKNFGKGKYRGIALAMPVTAFGLSGMWLSQAGDYFFKEKPQDKTSSEVDVFRFFIFLAILLFAVGIIGFFTLRVVDEQELIEEAIEELEHSGLLDGGSLIGRSDRGYGATSSLDGTDEEALLEPSKDEDAKWKKNFVLNAETRRFLTDQTMWPFALGFLLMIGPGDAFINNLGTIIGTLTPPEAQLSGSRTSAATHVSIFGVTNTLVRILIGSITDLVAPSPETQHIQVGGPQNRTSSSRRFSVSRVVFMLFFATLLAVGLLYLASGAVQNHPERFWIVSGLVGAGYGALFSLAPLMVTIIWGVENFATNFGIIAMLPALGSTFWGLTYSAVYQGGAKQSDVDDDLFCYGKQCYAPTFWAEGICVLAGCILILWAWKGRGGWQQRGVVI